MQVLYLLQRNTKVVNCFCFYYQKRQLKKPPRNRLIWRLQYFHIRQRMKAKGPLWVRTAKQLSQLQPFKHSKHVFIKKEKKSRARSEITRTKNPHAARSSFTQVLSGSQRGLCFIVDVCYAFSGTEKKRWLWAAQQLVSVETLKDPPICISYLGFYQCHWL